MGILKMFCTEQFEQFVVSRGEKKVRQFKSRALSDKNLYLYQNMSEKLLLWRFLAFNSVNIKT